MEAGKNPGINVNGENYPFPTLDTITLDEERILYIYSDCVVRDFIPAHPDASDEEKDSYQRVQMLKLRNPEFKRALAHIAYRRANPSFADQDIQKAIGAVNALEADIAMLWGDDDEDPTQTSQKQPDEKKSGSEESKLTDSGRPTTNGSAPVEEIPAPTGTTESATSSLGVAPTALAS
jgi:hypothetical protein